MANIIHRPGWSPSEHSITPETVFRNRRGFLTQLGFVGGGLLATTLVGSNKSGSPSSSAVDSSASAQGGETILPVKGVSCAA